MLTPIVGPLLPDGNWATYEEACDAVIAATGVEPAEHDKIAYIVQCLKDEPGSELLEDPEGL